MILLDNYVTKYTSTGKANYHYTYSSHISDERRSVSQYNYTCSYTDDEWYTRINGK